MRNRWRIATLSLVAATVGAVVGVPGADAQTAGTPESLLGSANGTALEVSVVGQAATFGVTKVNGDSAPKAGAEGAGQLLVESTTSKAAAGADRALEDPPQVCDNALPPDLTAAVGLSLGVACSDVVAGVQGGLPTATSKASVADLDLNANTLLGTLGLDEVVATLGLQEQIDTVTGQLDESLDPLIADTPFDGTLDTVNELLDTILETSTLRVGLGPSTSNVTGSQGSMQATSSAQGVVVEILPTGAIDPADPAAPAGPVATIEVASAKASSVYDRATGKATATIDPSLVKVTIDKTVALGLGLNDGTEDFVVNVAPGQNIPILEGTPLASRIIVAAGSTATNPDGSGTATADGVRLELLTGVEGGIILNLARAQATAGGVPATAPTPQPVATLPRTGGTPVLPFFGAGLLAVAVAVRRLVAGRR